MKATYEQGALRVCNYSAAFRLVSIFRLRNSFAGFVASNHCANKQHLVLHASGNGSMNESWLSQTGDAKKSRQAGTFRVLL